MEDVYGDFISHVKKLTCLSMTNKNQYLLQLRNNKLLLDLCFLVDIFKKLNQLNISCRGKKLIIDIFNHNKAFQKKLWLFESQLKNKVQHFSLLKELKNSKYNNYIKCAKKKENLQLFLRVVPLIKTNATKHVKYIHLPFTLMASQPRNISK